MLQALVSALRHDAHYALKHVILRTAHRFAKAALALVHKPAACSLCFCKGHHLFFDGSN